MANFKAGDKVRRTKYGNDLIEVGRAYEVVQTFANAEWLILNGINSSWDANFFELVKPEPKPFSMHAERWFIRTETPEKSKAVQEWLFERGFVWGNRIQDVQNTYGIFLTNLNSDFGILVYGVEDPGKRTDLGKEIVFNFQSKLVIESIVFPDSEAEERENFEAWWPISKYCQVIIPRSDMRQIALDGWLACARSKAGLESK